MFVNYEGVLPKDPPKSKISVNRDELLASLERAILCSQTLTERNGKSEKGVTSIHMIADDGALRMAGIDPTVGSIREVVEIGLEDRLLKSG